MSMQTHGEIEKLRNEVDALSDRVDNNARLCEEDINLIVDKVCEKIEMRVYQDVGHGIIKLAYRGVLLLVIVLAAYGAGIKHYFN